KGWNAWLASAASKVVVPVAPTRTGAGALPRSQSVSGDQPGVVGSMPSHCSTLTSVPGVYPIATTVNGNGLPAASAGTTKGVPVGCVIVPANATPVVAAIATNWQGDTIAIVVAAIVAVCVGGFAFAATITQPST